MNFGNILKKWAKGKYSEQTREAIRDNPQEEQAPMPAPMAIPSQGIIQRQIYQPAANPYYDPTRLMRQAPFGGFMADGGRVKKNRRYIVGEEGPEEIVLDQPGTVIPTDQLTPTREEWRTQITPPVPESDAARLIRPAATNNPYAPNPSVNGTEYLQDSVTAQPAEYLQDRVTEMPAAAASTPGDPAPPDARRFLNDEAAQAAARPARGDATPPDARRFINDEAAQAQARPQAAATAEEPVAIPEEGQQQPAAAAADPRDRLMRQPKASDDTWKQIEDLRQDKGEREKSLKNRLSSFGKASRSWDGQGGIVGWLAHTIFGGVRGATSEREYDKMRREDKHRRLFRDLGQQQSRETYEVQQTNTELQPYFKQQTADLKGQEFQNRIMRDHFRFQNQLSLLNRRLDAQKSEFKLEPDETTGRVMKVFTKDPSRKAEPYTDENGNQMYAPSHQVYDYTSPSGQVVKVKGSEVLKTDVGIAQANATTVNSQNKYNTEEWNDYQARVDKYNNDIADMSSKATAAINLAGEAQGQLEQLDNVVRTQGYAATAQQEQERSRLRDDIRTNRSKADQFMNAQKMIVKPTAPTAYKAQTVSTGKYAGRVFQSPSVLKQYFPGKTDDEIRRKVEQNGGKFEK